MYIAYAEKEILGFGETCESAIQSALDWIKFNCSESPEKLSVREATYQLIGAFMRCGLTNTEFFELKDGKLGSLTDKLIEDATA
jgi:hypothetical protein